MDANAPIVDELADIARALLLLALWVLYIWNTPYGYAAAYIAWSVFGWFFAFLGIVLYKIRRYNRALAAAPDDDARDYLEEHWGEEHAGAFFTLPVLVAIVCGLAGNWAVTIYGLETAALWTVGPVFVVVFGAMLFEKDPKIAAAEAHHELVKQVRQSRKVGHVLINPPHTDRNTNKQGGLE